MAPDPIKKATMGKKRKQAAGPATALAVMRASAPVSAGVAVTAETALRVTAVLRSITLISEAEASLPLVLYREEGRNEKFPATDHPLYRILYRRPNGWQTPFEFKRLLMTWLCQRGNAYAHVVRDEAGRVRALLPVHPSLVTPLRAFDGTPVYDFCVWPGTPRYRVTSDSMIHLRWATVDGYTGLSPIAVCAQSVGVSIAAEDYGARFFGGGAQPNGVLTMPGELSEAAAKRLRGQWEQTYAGLSNAHKTAILSDGAKYERIGIPPHEAQFLELRGFQVDDIGRIWGVPPHMLGNTTKSTSWGSGILEQSKGFLTFVLRPKYLTGTEEEFNRALLLDSEDGEYFIRHDTSELERGDMAALSVWASRLLIAGAISPNEVRSRFDMNPYDGGDQYRVPANTFATTDGKALAAGPAVEPSADTGDR